MCSAFRARGTQYSSVRASWENSDAVAPNSGDMLERVALSGTDIELSPVPQNSTELVDDAVLAEQLGQGEHQVGRGRAGGQRVGNRTPTTTGASRNSGWAEHAGLASMPPTPHPSTPMPLTIGVWESVPTSVSAGPCARRRPRDLDDLGEYSRLIW